MGLKEWNDENTELIRGGPTGRKHRDVRLKWSRIFERSLGDRPSVERVQIWQYRVIKMGKIINLFS